MNKSLEECKRVMVLKVFHLVMKRYLLKKYGKWFLKMCGNPDVINLTALLCVNGFGLGFQNPMGKRGLCV